MTVDGQPADRDLQGLPVSHRSRSTEPVDVCFLAAAGAGGRLDWPSSWSALVAALHSSGTPATIAVLPYKGRFPSIETVARTTGADRDRVVHVPKPPIPSSKGIFGGDETRAYQFYEWLKRQAFDVVHLPTAGGHGLFCLTAKREGLSFTDTIFCAHAQPTAIMHRLRALQPVDAVELLITDHMERRCLEYADLVVAPVAGMLDALRQHGVQIESARACVQASPLPQLTEAVATQPPDTLAFLGPLGHEGGLPQACAALSRLVDMPGTPQPRKVVFAGPSSPHFDVRTFLDEKAAGWPFDWEVRAEPDLDAIRALIADPTVLPVFPEPAPGVPDWLPICFAMRRPVLLRADGNGIETLHPEDRAHACFDPKPTQFAIRLADVLATPFTAVRPAHEDGAAAWAAWHTAPEVPGSATPPQDDSTERPLVTVCVMHHERPTLVRQTLASIEAQSYRNLEVVLLDDGSSQPETRAALDTLEAELAPRGWRVVHQENSYLGAARNTAARAASGTYLYFLDDDNVLKPEGLETFVRVAERTGADIVTAFSDVFEGTTPPTPGCELARNVFTGDNLAYGLFANAFGDSNALVRRDSFLELDGNSEDYGVGKDDQEFFARALLAGRTLALVPESLYWARRSEVRLRHKHFAQHAGDLRVSRSYVAALPSDLRGIALLAQGLRLRSTRASLDGPGHDDDSAAIRDTLTLASQHLADAPRLQGFANRVYTAQKTAFRTLIAFEVRLAQALGRVAKRFGGTGRGS